MVFIIVLITLSATVTPTSAHPYMDPGTETLIIQGILPLPRPI